MGRFTGEWVAVSGKKIVSHSPALRKVLAEIKGSFPDAAITKVPKHGQVMVL